MQWLENVRGHRWCQVRSRIQPESAGTCRGAAPGLGGRWKAALLPHFFGITDSCSARAILPNMAGAHYEAFWTVVASRAVVTHGVQITACLTIVRQFRAIICSRPSARHDRHRINVSNGRVVSEGVEEIRSVATCAVSRMLRGIRRA